MVSELAAVALLGAGSCVVALNWWCVYENARNRRLGSGKYSSTIAVVPQILVGLAWLVSDSRNPFGFPSHAFLVLAMIDPALWLTFMGLRSSTQRTPDR